MALSARGLQTQRASCSSWKANAPRVVASRSSRTTVRRSFTGNTAPSTRRAPSSMSTDFSTTAAVFTPKRLEGLSTGAFTSRPSISDMRRAIEAVTTPQAAALLMLGSGLVAVASDAGLPGVFLYTGLVASYVFPQQTSPYLQVITSALKVAATAFGNLLNNKRDKSDMLTTKSDKGDCTNNTIMTSTEAPENNTSVAVPGIASLLPVNANNTNEQTKQPTANNLVKTVKVPKSSTVKLLQPNGTTITAIRAKLPPGWGPRAAAVAAAPAAAVTSVKTPKTPKTPSSPIVVTPVKPQFSSAALLPKPLPPKPLPPKPLTPKPLPPKDLPMPVVVASEAPLLSSTSPLDVTAPKDLTPKDLIFKASSVAIPTKKSSAATGAPATKVPSASKPSESPSPLLSKALAPRPLSIAAIGCYIPRSPTARPFDPASPDCKPAGKGGILVANTNTANYSRKLALQREWEGSVDSRGLPAVQLGSMAELAATQWHELVVYAATPLDWGANGAKQVCWGDMRLVAAFGVAAAH